MQIPFDITSPSYIVLRTPNLNCIYEQGSLRYIKQSNTELIRMMYGAVRDSIWGTVPFSICTEKIIQYSNSFIVHYTAKYFSNGIEFEASFFIEGNENDTISFGMEGKALNGFSANRIGVCVHLPVQECCGQTCVIEDKHHHQIISNFPETISPHQPFTNITQMRWQLKNKAEIQLRFTGDEFEAEDQRNWMDYSYKIYNRSLHLPYPFTIEAGDTIQQTVHLNIVSTPSTNNNTATTIEDTNNPVSIPALAVAASDEDVLLTKEEIALLKKLPFKHYRAELDFDGDWTSIFSTHVANAKALNITVELVLFFTDDYKTEADLFLQTLSGDIDLIKTILPQHKNYKTTPLFLQEYFYPLYKAKYDNILIGYGTDIYFTELNRQRPQNDIYDFVSFSINPQVHSFDAATMLENINTISDIVATIRSFTDKSIIISPVTFRKRKNHDGEGASRHALVYNFDERQNTWFGAGWFLLCLYALHNVQQVSFFTTTGDSGVIGSFQPTPLYQVLEQLNTFEAVSMIKESTEESTKIIFKNGKEEELVFLLDKFFRGFQHIDTVGA